MMKRAWDAYVKDGWGENELQPPYHRGHASMFGYVLCACTVPHAAVMLYWCSGLRGLTIVDSFDTLHIMGLTEEAKKAQEFLLSDQLNFNQV
jgi:hypothetical protein